MIKLLNSIFRYVSSFFIITALINCSYSQNVANIEDSINHSSLKDVNKAGHYQAFLDKETQMSGKALILGPFCSAHSYPYDFDLIFDNTVSDVLDKVYETVGLEINSTEDNAKPADNINIQVEPVNVRIMCHAITEYNWECVATTKMTGKVNINGDMKKELIVEAKHASAAGGACGRGAEAVSNSIGKAINIFSSQLYDTLVLD